MGQTVKSRYITSLDGLRAFAVLAVIAYHLNVTWAQGGLLGVTIFFVLSGYLITGLLVKEYRETGSISLPQFWLRRVRRLIPAILFLLVTCAVLFIIFDHELLTKFREDVIPSLFFFENWWSIFRDVSYFQALGAPSPLTHFWSLAIEEQFYLVWPVLLLIVFKVGAGNKTVRRGCLVLAVISALAMAFIYNPLGDPSRVYYGTDTRAFSLLIGAWLAFAWPGSELSESGTGILSGRNRLILDAVGALAFIGIIAIIALVSGFSPFLYRGGILIVSILTAVLIAVIAHPQSMLARVFSFRPFTWIGQRSFGMYLWHFPIILLMTPRNSIGPSPWWYMLIEFALIVAVSAFSYRFIETPVRHGAVGDLLHSLADGTTTLKTYLRGHVVSSGVAGLLVVVAVVGCIVVPKTSAVTGIEAMQNSGVAVDEALDVEDDTVYDILLIGDSVSTRAVPYFEEHYSNGLIDSVVSRQLAQGVSVYDQYKQQGCVGDTVVISLGTNSPATDAEIDALIGEIGADKRIFLINTRMPDEWMNQSNETLARAAQRYSNVSLIDWAQVSSGHDEYFDGDGTHLTESAAKIYADMIVSAVGF